MSLDTFSSYMYPVPTSLIFIPTAGAGIPWDITQQAYLYNTPHYHIILVIGKIVSVLNYPFNVKHKQKIIVLAYDNMFTITLFSPFRKTVEAGLPDRSIVLNMKGSGGQSFCAFMAKGINVTLEGDANDYVGKVSGHGERSQYWSCSLTDGYSVEHSTTGIK